MEDDNTGSPQPDRRQFLLTTGSALAAGILAAHTPAQAGAHESALMRSLDGSAVEGAGAGHATHQRQRSQASDRFRGPRCSIASTKPWRSPEPRRGCDHGQCGACTVHVNGRRVLSCHNLALMHDGEEITTVEGLGTPEAMHPMQAAFLTCDAYQCGYGTSGQIMSAVALLKEPCGPDDAAVKELMSGNICRCGAYANIVAAIQQVRKRV